MDIDAEFDRVERARRERETKREARANAGLGFGRARMLDDLGVGCGGGRATKAATRCGGTAVVERRSVGVVRGRVARSGVAIRR
jgi:hypothetical protein